jgi:hypothetical protein
MNNLIYHSTCTRHFLMHKQMYGKKLRIGGETTTLGCCSLDWTTGRGASEKKQSVYEHWA